MNSFKINRNKQYDNELLSIIRNSQAAYAKKIYSIDYLLKYINENTPFLQDKKYSLGTKIFWVLNNIESWDDPRVCCKQCHNPLKKILSVNIFKGYPKHCSIKCGTSALECTEKKRKTCLEKYGVDHVSKSNEIIEKTKRTCLEKYNCETFLGSESCKEKAKQFNLANYGVEFYQQTSEYLDKIKSTSIERYGVDHPMKSIDVKNTLKNAFLEKYGVDNPIKNYDIRHKSKQKYFYDGKYFDSAIEISLYIYLKDNNIDFEYQPNMKFEYEFEGNKHYYFPDFKIENSFWEIKGNQFLKEDGTWQNPYDHSLDNLYEAKHQCCIENNVKILYYDDYKKYLNYIYKTYGKTYLKQFKHII